MFQISDNDGPLFTLDSIVEAFRLATVGSQDDFVYVTNLDNGHEVMMYQRQIVGTNEPTNHAHNHGSLNVNGAVCTILNCGE